MSGTAEVAESAAPKVSRWASVWRFFNSGLGIWLLSSVFLGGGAWTFEQWRQARIREAELSERFERLNFEVAGRTAQYLSWFNQQLLEGDGRTAPRFKASVSEQAVIASVLVFEDTPRRSSEAAPGLYIQELLPEFRDRNLLSLYGELNKVNNAKLRDKGVKEPETGCGWHDMPKPLSEPTLTFRQEAYGCALLALLEPRWLLRYEDLKFETFQDRFSAVFLTADIDRNGFPYTDCFWC